MVDQKSLPQKHPRILSKAIFWPQFPGLFISDTVSWPVHFRHGLLFAEVPLGVVSYVKRASVHA